MDRFAAGQLIGAEKAAFEAHLSDCAECRLDSELTRASKNAPTASPPPSATTQAAPRPSAGEWTIESIFGSASGSGAGSASQSTAASTPPSALGFESGSKYTEPTESGPPAEPPPTDEPEIPLPDVLHAPVPPRAGREVDAPANGKPGWQFESADAKEDAGPPEGSLFFAEEALSRTGTAPKAKSSFLRVVLWGAGGIVGLALLGISIWVALTLKPPATHVADTAGVPAPNAAAREAPARSDAAAKPEAPAASPSTPPAAAPRTSLVAESGAQPPPSPRETVAPTVSGRAVDTPSPAPPRTAEAAPPRTAEAAPPRPLWEPAIREEPSVRTPAAPPAPNHPRAASPPPAVATAPDDEPPAEEAPAPAPRPKPKPTPPPAPAVQEAPAADPIQRPIDRLHLATTTAEQNADLEGLRKMRETWKTFIKTSVGPDRPRAKRELGDCIWAIQTLTSNRSDQKAALAAYRDYVLNAPAGGADVRTVSRMRQLEDALAESH
jgi:hypothetical protein